MPAFGMGGFPGIAKKLGAAGSALSGQGIQTTLGTSGPFGLVGALTDQLRNRKPKKPTTTPEDQPLSASGRTSATGRY